MSKVPSSTLKSLGGQPSPGAPEPVSFGARVVDEALHGGLARGALHEIIATGTSDAAAATGFALGLACRAAGKKPIVWVRQDVLDTELGQPNARGLAELGLDPRRIILVRAHDATGGLRAAGEAARCGAIGAVVIAPWGDPRVLDLTASRRLSLATAKSGVTAFMLRVCARVSPSSAVTRWEVQPRPSEALAATAHCDPAVLTVAAKAKHGAHCDSAPGLALQRCASRHAPGFPVFAVTLKRHRGGVAERQWLVEWNRDQRCFEDRSTADERPVSRRVVPPPRGQPAGPGPPRQILRRAG